MTRPGTLGELKADGWESRPVKEEVRANALARIADRHYIMEKGRIVWQGGSSALAQDRALQMRYLGV